ncbi:hypothetical protein GCK32_020966 [Trichostrongylus colubriformis]|uniref:Uncharacterized protein n=1 Tax=Trichostrongylus colubriformis TaxID=6319 RepID=A0AAN8EUA6_TRICO
MRIDQVVLRRRNDNYNSYGGMYDAFDDDDSVSVNLLFFSHISSPL